MQDFTRQGALRFRLAGTEEFLGNEKMAAPPITTLRELEAVAYQLSSRRIDDLDALRKCNRSLSGVLFPPAPTRNNASHVHEGGTRSDQGDSDQQQVAAA